MDQEEERVETAYLQVFRDTGADAGVPQNAVIRDRLSGKNSSRTAGKGAAADTVIKVQFNPSTLSFSTYGARQGKKKKKVTLMQSGQGKMAVAYVDVQDSPINVSFKLIFDRTADKNADIQPDVDKFIALVRDPYVRQVAFCWGELSYKGVLKSVEAEYVLFNALGVPTRATLGLTLEGV